MQRSQTYELIEYTAPEPTKLKTSWTTWVKRIGIRLLFPPILLWDGIKFGVNRLAGETMGRLILAAQNDEYYNKYICTPEHPDPVGEKIKHINETKGAALTTMKGKVYTHDGACLDTFEIKQKADIPNNEKKYIINFLSAGMYYEEILNEMEEDAERLGCNIIGFNYRNVSRKDIETTISQSPKSENDLVTDGIAQVQRLLDNGIKPENITLPGHSLGGAIATLVTSHFKKTGVQINVFNDRSFSSITNFVIGHSRRMINNTETIFGKIVGYIIKPFVKLSLLATKWDMNVVEAYKNLPDAHKEYMVVQSSKEKRSKISRPKDDGTITPYASLHAALKESRQVEKARLDELIKQPHSSAAIQSGLANSPQALVDARAQFKKRKMVSVGEPDENAHMENRKYLYNRYDLGQIQRPLPQNMTHADLAKISGTGKRFFYEFFKRATGNSSPQIAPESFSSRLACSAIT
ncbi:MAG TPA: protein SidB [Gammaproteobacteria bacterium]|jgi:hypothetical protein|nr:protein SidB [Gammaproteobacteria bacterium]